MKVLFLLLHIISLPSHLLAFPHSLIHIMSTEEVQVSRKRAASEEVEVTVTIKAKKSKVPVAVTIILVSTSRLSRVIY